MEIIELKVQVRDENAKLELKNIQALADKLQNQTVKVKVEVVGGDKVSRELTAAINAQARLLEAKNQELRLTEKIAAAEGQAANRARQSAAEHERAAQAGGSAVQVQRTFGEVVGQVDQRLISNVKGMTEYIRGMEGMSNASVRANGAVGKFGTQFQKFTATVKNTDGGFSVFTFAANKATGEVHKMEKGVDSTDRSLVHMGDTFLNVYGKIIKWAVLTTIFYAPVRLLRQALDEMKAVDSEMVTIRKVTGASKEEMAGLERQAYKTAAAYGQMASGYLNAAAEFAKAGYQDLAAGLGELAVKTKVVGDTDQATANQFLLSVDAAYKYKGSIEGLERVLDGANEIGNRYATSVQKIAEGMGIVSSNAALAGISVDKLMAAIGTITAVTQRSGNEAARALRAVIMNIQGDVGALIDEETGEVVSQESVDQAKASLTELGIATREVKDGVEALRDPMAVIGDLARMFQEGAITGKQLTEVVTGLGGKLRSNQLSALIQNWDMYLGMLDTYAGSMGSADAELSIYLDSWEAKTNQLSAAWTEFVAKTVDTEWIKSLIDLGIGLLDVGDELGVTLSLILGIVIALKAAKLVEYGGKAVAQIKEVWTALRLALQNLKALKNGVDLTTLSTSQWLSVLGVGISVLSACVMAYRQVKQEIAEHRQESIKAGQAMAEENRRIQDLYAAYIQAEQAVKEGTGSRKDFEAATSALLSAMGYEGAAVEYLAEQYGGLSNAVQQVTLETLKQQLIVMQDAFNAAQKDLAEFGADFPNKYNYLVGFGETGDPASILNTISALEKYLSELRETGQGSSDLYNIIYQGWNDLSKAMEPYTTAVENLNAVAANQMTRMQESLPTTVDELERFRESLVATALASRDAGKAFVGTDEQVRLAVDSAINSMPELAMLISDLEKVHDKITALRTPLDALPGVLAKVQGRYELLAKAQKEMDESGALSVATVSTLLEKYPELSGYLELTADGYVLTRGALEDYMDTQQAEYEISLNEAKQAAIQRINQENDEKIAIGATTQAIKEKLAALKAEAGANMAAVRQRAIHSSGEDRERYWQEYDQIKAEADAFENAITEIENAEASIIGFQAARTMLGRDSAGGGKGKSEKETDPWKEEADSLLKEYRHLRAMELMTDREYYDKVSALDAKYFAGRDEYVDEHRSLLEELFQLQRQLDEGWFTGKEQDLELMGRQGAGVDGQVAVYREIMARAHELAQAAREAGAEEDGAYIQGMVDRWWEAFGAIKDLQDSELEEMMSGYEDYVEVHNYWGDWSTDSEVRTWKRALAELEAYYAKRGEKDEAYYKWRDTLERNYYESVLDLWDELGAAVDKVLSNAKEKMQDRVNAIDEIIDARKKEREEEEDQLELEEKRLAVEEARKKLRDAENERTVRVLRGETWEWVYDAKAVKDAREEAEKAKQELQEYEDELKFQAGIDELEAQKDAIQREYEAFADTWKDIKASIEDPGRDMADILNDIAAEGLPRMKAQVDSVVDLLNRLSSAGYGGGNKGGESGGASMGLGGAGGAGVSGSAKTIADYAKDYADARARGDAASMAAANQAANALREMIGDKPQDASQDINHIRNQGKGKSYDSGGVALGRGVMVKDTDRRESVLGPELTAAILEPTTSLEFERFTKGLGILLGTVETGSRAMVDGASGAGSDSHDVNYYINGLQVPREAAEQRPLSEVLRTLRLQIN